MDLSWQPPSLDDVSIDPEHDKGLPKPKDKLLYKLLKGLSTSRQKLIQTSMDRENPGMSESGNIDLWNRPILKNKDGSISTVRSMSFEVDGKQVLVPTVGPKGEDWTPEDAIKNYFKTGKHLGKFNTTEDADRYAEQLHRDQEEFYQ